jgi:hypothetical protein
MMLHFTKIHKRGKTLSHTGIYNTTINRFFLSSYVLNFILLTSSLKLQCPIPRHLSSSAPYRFNHIKAIHPSNMKEKQMPTFSYFIVMLYFCIDRSGNFLSAIKFI